MIALTHAISVQPQVHALLAWLTLTATNTYFMKLNLIAIKPAQMGVIEKESPALRAVLHVKLVQVQVLLV